MPIANSDPGKLVLDTIGVPDSSVAIGSVQFTVANESPGSVGVEMSDGQLVNEGSVTSETRYTKPKDVSFMVSTVCGVNVTQVMSGETHL